MDEVGVSGVHAGVPGVLVFRAVALIVLVEDIVVIDQRVGRIREELQQQLLDFRVEHALHFRGVVEVPALRLEMRQRDAEPVHAFGASGREARIVFADPARIAQHLREVEAAPPAGGFIPAQQVGFGLARRVPPERIGRHDGIGRVLIDGVPKRKRHAAFRGLNAVGADMLHTLVISTESEAPFGLDRARRRIVEPVDKLLAVPFGNLLERRLQRRSGPGIAVPLERHVGEPAIRGDGRRLSLRQLERRHIGLRLRIRPVPDGLLPVHDMLSG